ncbi:MAG: M50 family metallopeptidase, partial [Pseudomonadota bacterium]
KLTYYNTGILSAEMFISEVTKGTPAEKIGMKPGDRVIRFDRRQVNSWSEVEQTLEAMPDEKHSLVWVPYGGVEKAADFQLAKEKFSDYGTEQERYVFGVKKRLLTKTADPIPIENRFVFAISESVLKVGEVVGVMTIGLVQWIRGAIPRDSMGSVVMLAYVADAAAEKGWDHFLWILALISINLGILNLLPIPILDGGHVLFFTVEAIRRRPLSLRVREIASYVGLVLLVSLMIFAIKNDIVRYWFKY